MTDSREEKLKDYLPEEGHDTNGEATGCRTEEEPEREKEQEERDGGTRRWIISKGRIVARRM